MKDYVIVLKKYFDFHGRARRREYWMFVLFNVLISWLLIILCTDGQREENKYGADPKAA